MRLRLDLAASVPKDLERQDLNEDAWAVSENCSRLALSDGASESYDSRTWARLLVEKYVVDPLVVPDWVSDAVNKYNVDANYDSLIWSKRAAFDRGSFATLLGVELAPDANEVEVLAIGDSTAFHISSGALVASFPYSSADAFDARPLLLSTIQKDNAFVSQCGFWESNSSKTWPIKAGDSILLVTDAVGQWVLREQAAAPTAIEQLQAVSSQAEFAELVLALRGGRRMKLDDSTLLRFLVEED